MVLTSVPYRFHWQGYENREQRQEAAVDLIVKNAACSKEEGEGEEEKQGKTGHVNHEPGSKFSKRILARS